MSDAAELARLQTAVRASRLPMMAWGVLAPLLVAPAAIYAVVMVVILAMFMAQPQGTLLESIGAFLFACIPVFATAFYLMGGAWVAILLIRTAWAGWRGTALSAATLQRRFWRATAALTALTGLLALLVAGFAI